MYRCIKPCIAIGYDFSKKVQVLPKEQYKLEKQVRNTVTLVNAKRTIRITRDQLENNFIKV